MIILKQISSQSDESSLLCAIHPGFSCPKCKPDDSCAMKTCYPATPGGSPKYGCLCRPSDYQITGRTSSWSSYHAMDEPQEGFTYKRSLVHSDPAACHLEEYSKSEYSTPRCKQGRCPMGK